MKANEAPEKLYVDLFKGEFNVSYSPINNSVEYIRTDAFIEKARKWFEEHFGNRLKWEITTYEFEDIQNMVEDFKNYMKRE